MYVSTVYKGLLCLKVVVRQITAVAAVAVAAVVAAAVVVTC
jgi:ABC-type Fe3+ transport system permease subunit